MKTDSNKPIDDSRQTINLDDARLKMPGFVFMTYRFLLLLGITVVLVVVVYYIVSGNLVGVA